MCKITTIKRLLAFITALSLMFACCPEVEPKDNENNANQLQDLVNDVNNGVLDLTGKTDLTNYTANIDKPITIKNTPEGIDISLNINTKGVTLENVSVDNVNAKEGIGNGDLTIKDTQINNLLVQGGGSNSIHLANVNIYKLTLDKNGVRVVIEDYLTSTDGITTLPSVFGNIVVTQPAMFEDNITNSYATSDRAPEEYDKWQEKYSMSSNVVDAMFYVGSIDAQAPLALAGCTINPNNQTTASFQSMEFYENNTDNPLATIVANNNIKIIYETLPNMLLEYASRQVFTSPAYGATVCGWTNTPDEDSTFTYYDFTSGVDITPATGRVNSYYCQIIDRFGANEAFTANSTLTYTFTEVASSAWGRFVVPREVKYQDFTQVAPSKPAITLTITEIAPITKTFDYIQELVIPPNTYKEELFTNTNFPALKLIVDHDGNVLWKD